MTTPTWDSILDDVESQLDLAAHLAGLDPTELRRRLAQRLQPSTNPGGGWVASVHEAHTLAPVTDPAHAHTILDRAPGLAWVGNDEPDQGLYLVGMAPATEARCIAQGGLHELVRLPSVGLFVVEVELP